MQLSAITTKIRAELQRWGSLLFVIFFTNIVYATGLTVDYHWERNLSSADCRYLVLWAKEEVKKRELRMAELQALLDRHINPSLATEYTNEIAMLAQEIKSLQYLYIHPFDIQTLQLLGRLPQ